MKLNALPGQLAVLSLLVLIAIKCVHSAHPHRHTPAITVSAIGQTAVTLPANGNAPGIHFREVAQSAGLNYRWKIPGKRPLNILQTIGNGCAFLDYDNDGNLDILLVGPKLALYRGDGKGHFTDATAETGLDKLSGHFLGCAVGDYDNDGYDDLYITAYRGGLLLHNEALAPNPSSHAEREESKAPLLRKEKGRREGASGVRVFRDVTAQAGLKPQPWGTSCGFADLDGDGYLDLVVANYVKFDKSDLQLCPYHGTLTGCGPNDYDARKVVVYHNLGGTHFENVTAAWHVNTHGKGLGVAFADYEASGHVGVAIANDLQPGDLLQNTGHTRFKNVGTASGMALDGEGDTHAGMGIDWGDYDNDGKFDLFVTTFGNEAKCLYHNEGIGRFAITNDATGIDRTTLPYVGWGCKFFDADNDGWLDLVIANGHVQDNIHRFEKTGSYRQPTLFLHNLGAKSKPVAFEDATKSAGLTQLSPIVGRGVAVGDYDNDGKPDVLVVDSEGAPLLLHNESGTPNNWIGFRLQGAGKSNHNAYGAIITVMAGGQSRVRQCQSGGSYLSASDSRVLIGLGQMRPDSIRIQWPDGSTQTCTDLAPNRYYTITQGQPPN